jgi:hypothetical protein
VPHAGIKVVGDTPIKFLTVHKGKPLTVLVKKGVAAELRFGGWLITGTVACGEVSASSSLVVPEAELSVFREEAPTDVENELPVAAVPRD